MSWGEIYNTSWWGVALDTARTVKARPDFFGSQLNLLTSEQPNLVVNGTFDTVSDWILGTGWSISGGKAVRVASSSTDLVQASVFPNLTSIFKITFDVVRSAGAVRLRAGTFNLPYVNATDTYTYYVTPTSNDQIKFQADSSFVGSIDNVSVQVERAELDQIEAKKCLADWIHTTALKDLNN